MQKNDFELLVCSCKASLITQLVEAASHDPGVSLRLDPCGWRDWLWSELPLDICVLVDASDRPEIAMESLHAILPRIDTRQVAIYTELMHDGLELFARLRGMLLLLGPMHTLQWLGYFQCVRRTQQMLEREVNAPLSRWKWPARGEVRALLIQGDAL